MTIDRRKVLGAGAGALVLGFAPLRVSARRHSAEALADELRVHLQVAVRPDVGPVEITIAEFTRSDAGAGAALAALVVVSWRPGTRSMRFRATGPDVAQALAQLIAQARTGLACFQGPLETT